MSVLLSRRALLEAIVGSVPLLAATSCARKAPDTPLAHLYGKEWVKGAYEMYASRSAQTELRAKDDSLGAYATLASSGIGALDTLQARDIPFFVRVDGATSSFRIEREVPERLKFTADMDDAARARATEAWTRAREHIQEDYTHVRRLNGALEALFRELRTLRLTIDEGEIEQFRLVAQLEAMKGDPSALPYELPFQVSRDDYRLVVLLLVERIEDDRKRLADIEADVLSMGLTVRAADSGSGSLALAIRKVLLAVLADASRASRPVVMPEAPDERARLRSEGEALAAKIAASPHFSAWRKAEQDKAFAAFRTYLTVLDMATGLPTSGVFNSAVSLWRGEADYLTYLKTLATFVPHGGEVAKVVEQAIEYTEKARTVVATVSAVAKGGLPSTDALASEAGGLLINTGSRFARERIGKQLVYFKDKAEVRAVHDALAQHEALRGRIPALPAL